MVRELDTTDLQRALDNGEVHSLFDARSPEDFEKRHIKGAINLPVKDARAGIGLPDDKDARIVFYCSSFT